MGGIGRGRGIFAIKSFGLSLLLRSTSTDKIGIARATSSARTRAEHVPFLPADCFTLAVPLALLVLRVPRARLLLGLVTSGKYW